ncbi:DUF6391 domain-containing protein [Geitlerinema sp. PCC 9228]|jgi:hypothetical protein|uniref:DUF6391 domain-containing protein n=1 Tax=Geitlerinema sp. PCC 9228 TaxID=111611 RepID=UPI0008F9BF2C|nr:DUF6391 domain-containing protein [Geitlerinema sp. PCC 9228]
MTSTASTGQYPFEFVPRATQDLELLEQLNFFPGLKELLMLRQVHALEHATVWVLSETSPHRDRTPNPPMGTDNQMLGGMSTESGFYLYGQVNKNQLENAVRTALQRITSGEWDLAVHPRCGTNLSVSLLLTAGFAVGANFFLPKDPLTQLAGLGLAATTAATVAPDLGAIAQKYLTTSIPFNLAFEEILPVEDMWGRPAHFVRLRWQQ